MNKFQIILIEDNPDDANLTIRAFRAKHLDDNVIHLKDGQEALDFFFSNAEFQGQQLNDAITSIVLLDIRMPKVDGIEVLKSLKASEDTKIIPVVMLTSSTEDPMIEKCRDLGADDYIIKPVTYEGFEEVVARLVPYWKEFLKN